MVDEEVLADGGAGVDVNAGETVGVLGHDAGNEGHLQQVQLMCQAVDHDGVETGVGEDDLVGVERCRVAHKGGFHVHGQVGLDAGQGLDELAGDGLRLGLPGGFIRVAVLVALEERQGDLAGQAGINLVQNGADIVFCGVMAHFFLDEVVREQHGLELLDDGDDGALVRLQVDGLLTALLHGFRAGQQLLHYFFNLRFHLRRHGYIPHFQPRRPWSRAGGAICTILYHWSVLCQLIRAITHQIGIKYAENQEKRDRRTGLF